MIPDPTSHTGRWPGPETWKDGGVRNHELDLPTNDGTRTEDLKRQVRAARLTAQRTVNTQLIELYWSSGSSVVR